MKPRKTISSYVLLVGVLGLSIVGGVLAYQIYAGFTKSQITSEQQVIIKPLDGQLETKVIDNLSARRIFSESELSVLPVITPAPTGATVSGNLNQ